LHRAEAILATNLVVATPDRTGNALLPGDLGADMTGDHGGGAEAAQRARDVQESLVERERLHLRRNRAEDTP